MKYLISYGKYDEDGELIEIGYLANLRTELYPIEAGGNLSEYWSPAGIFEKTSLREVLTFARHELGIEPKASNDYTQWFSSDYQMNYNDGTSIQYNLSFDPKTVRLSMDRINRLLARL